MRVYMELKVGERAATPCIIPTVKHGGGSILVCVGGGANTEMNIITLFFSPYDMLRGEFQSAYLFFLECKDS